MGGSVHPHVQRHRQMQLRGSESPQVSHKLQQASKENLQSEFDLKRKEIKKQ